MSNAVLSNQFTPNVEQENVFQNSAVGQLAAKRRAIAEGSSCGKQAEIQGRNFHSLEECVL